MNRSDLFEVVHEKTGMTKKASEEAVSLILDTIKDSLDSGETVKISGFGVFEVRTKKARKGRNPQTGEEVIIPQRRVVSFRASQLMKERLNNGK